MADITTVAGVYASQPADTEGREAYYALLAGEDWIDGAEIPFPGELADAEIRRWLAQHLPENWHNNNITLIPGTMQSLGKNPDFGLASPVKEGRQAALDHLKTMRDALEDFVALRGSEDVRYVQIHTAPKAHADADSMRLSLNDILSWNWSGAHLVVEHCDKFIEGQPAEKGFLDIEEEIALAHEFGIGLTINWGRSVVEGRSALRANQHIARCVEEDVLTGLMFSGAGPEATQYGYEWIDGHLPLSSDEPASLMTPELVAEGYEIASQSFRWVRSGYVGVKVCVPANADLQTRLSYMKNVYEAIHGTKN
ncbi:DUF4862 family protein [Alloscardovia criceti]|uniref:DUF4862 family protein n=1 Tax=Alloscardovia criceti TaxID=356828 RepID=UPI00035DEA21|nr:DUF4862 family protein [Alloscardovia criceti]